METVAQCKEVKILGKFGKYQYKQSPYTQATSRAAVDRMVHFPEDMKFYKYIAEVMV